MHGDIPRLAESELRRALARAPATVILGPRQCGKSTLAKHWIAALDALYLDLQDRVDRARLAEPELFFEHHRARLICLDAIQLLPGFFAALRSEIDRDRHPGRFLILGSASRDLIRQANETLAGRVAHIELTPFLLMEVSGAADWKTLWVRGGFPESLMARDEHDSFDWRSDFVRIFLERDIPALGFAIPLPLMERLWRLLAHHEGQTLNYSKLAGSLDLSVPTLKRYLAVLEQTYMVRLLAPFEANLKRWTWYWSAASADSSSRSSCPRPHGLHGGSTSWARTCARRRPRSSPRSTHPSSSAAESGCLSWVSNSTWGRSRIRPNRSRACMPRGRG